MNPGQQDAAEQDWLSGPGVTPEEAVHPGFFGGLGVETPVQGVVAGVADGVGALTGGLSYVATKAAQGARAVYGSLNDLGQMQSWPGMRASAGMPSSPEPDAPWLEKSADWTQRVSDMARHVSKEVAPDPRLTGTAANVVFGASKVLSQAAALTAAGGPEVGALGTGYITGMSRYRDLRDQGVDETTAEKMATIDGAGQAASFFVPMGLPAKWLSEIGPIKQIGAQIAAGALANAGQGVATRYIGSKILSDAGYHEMADAQRPFDAEALEADLLAGGFFGGAHYFSGAREAPEAAKRAQDAAENGLPSLVRDSAKATQDAHQVAIERAPGVPVDRESQAVHQASLSKAVEDLLADRPVDVGADRGTFARGSEHDERTRETLLNAFKEAGVAEEAARFDDLNDALEERYGPVKPQERPIELPAEEHPTGDAEAFMKEFEEKYPENPQEPTERLVNGVRVEMAREPFDVGAVHLASIMAPEPGKGAGAQALREITDMADRHGVRVTLVPHPLQGSLMNAEQLRGWYGKHGFTGEPEDLQMERSPQRPETVPAEDALAYAKRQASETPGVAQKVFQAAANCIGATR